MSYTTGVHDVYDWSQLATCRSVARDSSKTPSSRPLACVAFCCMCAPLSLHSTHKRYVARSHTNGPMHTRNGLMHTTRGTRGSESARAREQRHVQTYTRHMRTPNGLGDCCSGNGTGADGGGAQVGERIRDTCGLQMVSGSGIARGNGTRADGGGAQVGERTTRSGGRTTATGGRGMTYL